MALISDDEFGTRVRGRLTDERVVWLVTVGADGTPQANPVWFLWDGSEHALTYNRADAHRLAHVDARPEVGLHFDGDGTGGNVVVFSGTARRAPSAPPSHENAAYVAKYGASMTRVAGSTAEFAEAYPIALEIELRRVRGH